MVFGVFDFLQKMNENKSNWGIVVVKLNSLVRFLEEIEDTKNHFEIIWPLMNNVSRCKAKSLNPVNSKPLQKKQIVAKKTASSVV